VVAVQLYRVGIQLLRITIQLQAEVIQLQVEKFYVECEFTENEELTFLAFYFQRETKEEELECMLMHKIFQDYLWSLWTFYKEAQGDDFGSYGMLRLKRAKENMQLFHETFNRTEAG